MDTARGTEEPARSEDNVPSGQSLHSVGALPPHPPPARSACWASWEEDMAEMGFCTISGQQKDRKGSCLQVWANFAAALAFECHQHLCCNEPPVSLQCISRCKSSDILLNLIVLNLC